MNFVNEAFRNKNHSIFKQNEHISFRNHMFHCVTYENERSRVFHPLNVKLLEHLSSDEATMTWKRFRRYWPFVWESTGNRWIPFAKGQ